MWHAFLDGFAVLGEKWIVALSVTIVTCLGCGMSLWFALDSSAQRRIPWKSVLLPGFFFIISVILRLAFLTDTFVPPYFDSVEHYRIIENLMAGLDSPTLPETLPRLTTSYYHLGFHFIAALLTLSLHASPIDVILVLGQVILAAIPIPLFFLIRHETASDAAAFFTMFLAGFGWYMPGFAVNWGKYPALAGLLAFEIVLVSACFLAQKGSAKDQFASKGFLLLGIIVAALLHTRTLVVAAISFVSWGIAGKLNTPVKAVRSLAVLIPLAGIAGFEVSVGRAPLLTLTLEPYLGAGAWITWMVLILSPFALAKFPRGFTFNVLFVVFVLCALFIPVGIRSPGLENQTLLDRPFAEMLLYLPMSILGGLGLAGLLKTLDSIRSLPETTRPYARTLSVTLILAIASLVALWRYDFTPSDCGQFVAYDDTIALDWVDRNLSPDAHLLISATQLNVLPTEPPPNLVGTDAGIWIPVLTGRFVSRAPFDTDFHTASTLEQLCQMEVDYIYVGGTKQSFDAGQLRGQAEWYKRILSLPDAQLYQLTGCK
jgi:hypothetical protein